MQNLKVGFYTKSEGVKSVALRTVMDWLKNQKFRHQVDRYHQQSMTQENINKFDYIDCFIVHAQYESFSRSLKNDGEWAHHKYELSGLIHADLDNIEVDKFDTVVEKLKTTDPLFLFKSPNGGVKVFWQHNLKSTIENKTNWTYICRDFIKGTLESLGLGEYYDHAPTHPNANCFFSAGKGFVYWENEKSGIIDLTKIASKWIGWTTKKAELEAQIDSIDTIENMHLRWNELERERQNRINNKIKNKRTELIKDVRSTNSKSKGVMQAYRLACTCCSLGVGYTRTVQEVSLFRRMTKATQWIAKTKVDEAFKGKDKQECFMQKVYSAENKLKVQTLRAQIDEIEARKKETTTKTDSRFNLDFIKLSDASASIEKALSSNDDLYLRVTAGVGKSHAAMVYAKEQARQGKNVAFYVQSKDFQNEIHSDLQATKKSGWYDNAIEIIGRNDKNCSDYKVLGELQKRERLGESGLVSNHCTKNCLYAGGEGCLYASQFKDAGKVRIYTHAHLFTNKSVFDDWEADISIIDEDAFGSAYGEDRYSFEQGKRLTNSFKSVANFNFTGAVGKIITELAKANIKTKSELYDWCIANKGIVTTAYNEQKMAQEYAGKNMVAGEAFIEYELINKLTMALLDGKGTNEIYTHNGIIYHCYLKSVKLSSESRIIAMDATGNIEVAQAVFKRKLRAISVDVEKSTDVEVIQVFNTGASQTRINNNKEYNDARLGYLAERKSQGASVITKKNETNRTEMIAGDVFNDLYFGKSRGSNKYETAHELHIGMGFNLPQQAIENAARAVFSGQDITWNQERAEQKVHGRGISTTNYVYINSAMRLLDNYLSDAELEQAAQRGRLVRRNKESSLKLIIHTNKVLNITVDKIITWQNLYGVKSGGEKKSESAHSKFIDILKKTADNGLIWKRKNIIAAGATADQWKRNSLDSLCNHFNIYDVHYKDKHRNKKNTTVIYSDKIIGLLELLNAKEIINIQETFASNNIDNSTQVDRVEGDEQDIRW